MTLNGEYILERVLTASSLNLNMDIYIKYFVYYRKYLVILLISEIFTWSMLSSPSYSKMIFIYDSEWRINIRERSDRINTREIWPFTLNMSCITGSILSLLWYPWSPLEVCSNGFQVGKKSFPLLEYENTFSYPVYCWKYHVTFLISEIFTCIII